MISKLGGRKFLKGIFLVGVAIAMELLSPRGLTPIMASFLFSIGTAFFVANVKEKQIAAASPPLVAPLSPTPQQDLGALTEAVQNTQQGVGLIVNYINQLSRKYPT